MTQAVSDAFRYNRLVLATTTYNAGIYPFMREFIEHLTERGFQNRTVGMIENGTWAPMAQKVMRTMLEGCKNITFTEASVHIQSSPDEESDAQVDELAKELCRHSGCHFFL
jgi:flavorubredoxin